MVKKPKTMGAKLIAYIAVLTALSALANIFTVILGGGAFAVSFAYIPAFIAGAFINPLAGLLTGMLGDLLGCIIAPKGAINPIILVTSGLLGFIPGMVFWIARKNDMDLTKYSYALTAVSFILLLIICLPLNTIGLYLFYFMARGRTLAAVFGLRMPKQTIILAVNFIIVVVLQKPISKLIKI
ncbi:MAG: folate family ECF transporter S component [Clostridiales bacterium]|nr:folate family ECF transporter S component [Clostridiales bacterium]